MRKKEGGSLRGNVLPSVKLQPKVFHVTPETLQTSSSSNKTTGTEGRDGSRDLGAGRVSLAAQPPKSQHCGCPCCLYSQGDVHWAVKEN